MNLKYSCGIAATARYRERSIGGPSVNLGHVVTIIGGGAVGLGVVLFLVSMISGVLTQTAQTLNGL